MYRSVLAESCCREREISIADVIRPHNLFCRNAGAEPGMATVDLVTPLSRASSPRTGVRDGYRQL
jgi:hypothetical protein